MFNNPMQVLQNFMQFRNSFSGNPQQAVQELLNSGKMTQQQYNQLAQMAKEFQNTFGFR